MNKVVYINNDGVFNINKDETLEIYHYVVDKSVNIKINLNGENAKVIYHLSIISNNDNVCKVDVNHVASNTESKIICHGVNTGNKKLEFNVTGLVPKDISKCVCKEENQIINLSDGTKKTYEFKESEYDKTIYDFKKSIEKDVGIDADYQVLKIRK